MCQVVKGEKREDDPKAIVEIIKNGIQFATVQTMLIEIEYINRIGCCANIVYTVYNCVQSC